MWTQPHATICGWPEDSFLLELYRRAFTLSQMHLVPDTPSAVKKQLHKRAKQTARRPGDPLTSKPRRSFSFQKQKCVTFLSQNSSGFTTHTSDTSAGITFWETAATRRQNTGRGNNTQAHKLGGGEHSETLVPATWAPRSSRCSTGTSVRPRWRWSREPCTSHCVGGVGEGGWGEGGCYTDLTWLSHPEANVLPWLSWLSYLKTVSWPV